MAGDSTKREKIVGSEKPEELFSRISKRDLYRNDLDPDTFDRIHGLAGCGENIQDISVRPVVVATAGFEETDRWGVTRIRWCGIHGSKSKEYIVDQLFPKAGKITDLRGYIENTRRLGYRI